MHELGNIRYIAGKSAFDVLNKKQENTYGASSSLETHMICFTKGSCLATPQGEVAVEALRPGDRIITRDNGIQRLLWVGQRDLTGKQLLSRPSNNPIRICKGALGKHMPQRDLWVSPKHRILIRFKTGQRPYGESEILVAAQYLKCFKGVEHILTTRVQYIHLMFEHHEIVLANGVWTESFQPDAVSLNGITEKHRTEIVSLLPELRTKHGLAQYHAARKTLPSCDAKLLNSVW